MKILYFSLAFRPGISYTTYVGRKPNPEKRLDSPEETGGGVLGQSGGFDSYRVA